MSDFYPSFYSELKGKVKNVWTEITDVLWFTSHQALRQNLLEQTTPFVAIVIGEYSTDADWGLTNKAFRAPVEVFYVVDVAAGRDNQQYVGTKCKNLIDAIDDAAPYTFTYFQPIERGTVDTSVTNGVNEHFLDVMAPLIAGKAYWNPGFIIGEQ